MRLPTRAFDEWLEVFVDAVASTCQQNNGSSTNGAVQDTESFWIYDLR